MARINVKRYRDVYVHLSHGEACSLIGYTGIANIAGFLGAAQGAGPLAPFLTNMAGAILFSMGWIQEKNENSGGKGIRLRFDLLQLCIVIVGIKRKGDGISPCDKPDTTFKPAPDREQMLRMVEIILASGITRVNFDSDDSDDDSDDN